MSVGTESKKWTYESSLKIEDEHQCEILEGDLFKAPATNLNHQLIATRLSHFITIFVFKNKLGYVVSAPTDVVFDAHNKTQPDILFIAKENRSILKKAGVFGAPDIVVEILSPSTKYRDLVEKKNVYEAFGVPEYWVVDPYMKDMEIFTLDEKKYRLFSQASLEDGEAFTVRSKRLNGLEVNLQEIFTEEFDK